MNEPNRHQPDDPNALVEQYRRHGQVEPPAELDRLIRARADQAVGQSSGRRPLTWISGLATTAVLLLSVSVVLRLETLERQPPQPAVFEPIPAQEPTPAAAQERRARSSESVRAAADEQHETSSAPQPKPAPASPVPDTHPDRQASYLIEQGEPRLGGQALGEQAEPLDSDKPAVDEQLQAIEQAIESGDLDRARLLLDIWRRDNPGHPAFQRLIEQINELQPEGD